MSEMNRDADANAEESKWKSLYKVSGWAALIAALVFRRNLAEEFLLCRQLHIIRSGPTSLPANAVDWFTVLHAYRFIGLTFLNLFDMVNYALVGLMFLGLYAGLKRVERSYTIVAIALAMIGVGVYFASNQAFALLSLSDQYPAATTDAQRSSLLAIQNSSATYGNGIYVSFLLVNLAGLIFATVMLRSRAFGKLVAYVGILANLFGLGYYVTLVLTPSMSVIPLSASAPFLLVWYILISRKLLRLGLGGAGVVP
jgi:hypothetical protein